MTITQTSESNGNILLVDDVHENLQILTDLLSAQGYTVRPVSRGEQAFRSIREESPDLILLDIRMPGLSGYEVCSRLKAQPETREIPVIFLSALHEVDDKVKAFAVGGIDFITKPFQAEEVLARVATHLALRTSQKTLQAANRRLQQEIEVRQKTEQELRKLSRAVEQSANIIMITDLHGRIEFVNPAFSALTGYTAAEVLGQNPRVLKSGRHTPEFYRNLWSTITRGEVWQGDIVNKKKNGELYVEVTNISSIKDADGRMTHYLAIKHDITRQKEHEQALEHLNRQLQYANSSKDKFFSIIAHDLRNPLSGLLAITEAMTAYFGESSDLELAQLLYELKTSAETVYALLENLLSWTRLQQGIMQYDPQEIDIEKLIDHNFTLFATLAHQKRIQIRRSITGNTIVYADYHMINTVLRNLLSNAIKFTYEHGAIDVSVRSQRDALEVAVTDTGTGIEADDVVKLFRIDTKHTEVGTRGEKGTGLGLILCKELVEKNNGRLDVQSIPGEGTTFRLTLPRRL